MPIISRQLESVQPSSGGVLASFLAVDNEGREWRRSRSRFNSETEAQTALDVFDWTVQLKSADFNDLLVWTQAPAKNDPGTFDLTGRDLTLLEGEDRLFTHFAEGEGGEAIRLAWWIKGMNPPTFDAIRIRLGLDVTDGDRVKDRAVALDDAEATFDDSVSIG